MTDWKVLLVITMPEYILWGVAKDDPDWYEQIITNTSNKELLPKAEEWAKRNGFRNLRIAEYNGEKPEYQNT
jgi:uncharacterized protein YutE (UPF0331/DUF86 family)